MVETITNTQAVEIDLEYFQGEEFNRAFTILDADSNPIDYTDKTLLMQIKNYREDSTALKEFTDQSGISINVNVLTFSGTADLYAGSYYYDLWNMDDNLPIMYGRFIVTGRVSQ